LQEEERTDPQKHLDIAYEAHMVRYRRAAARAASRKALDIGCGYGAGTREIAREALFAVGIDRDRATIITASGRAASSPAAFAVADARELPFADETFDVISAFEVMEHLPEPERFLDEARRTLTRDGDFFISAPRQRPGWQSENPGHLREYTAGEFSDIVNSRFEYCRFFGLEETEEFKQDFRRITKWARLDIFGIAHLLGKRMKKFLLRHLVLKKKHHAQYFSISQDRFEIASNLFAHCSKTPIAGYGDKEAGN